MTTPANKVLVMAALVTVFAAPSGAAERDDGSIHVRYDDIDLSTPAGVDQLRGRLRTAARKVCDQTGVGAIWLLSRVPECVREAVDEAMAQVTWPAKS
jgi:UrcA family protein